MISRFPVSIIAKNRRRRSKPFALSLRGGPKGQRSNPSPKTNPGPRTKSEGPFITHKIESAPYYIRRPCQLQNMIPLVVPVSLRGGPKGQRSNPSPKTNPAPRTKSEGLFLPMAGLEPARPKRARDFLATLCRHSRVPRCGLDYVLALPHWGVGRRYIVSTHFRRRLRPRVSSAWPRWGFRRISRHSLGGFPAPVLKS